MPDQSQNPKHAFITRAVLVMVIWLCHPCLAVVYFDGVFDVKLLQQQHEKACMC